MLKKKRWIIMGIALGIMLFTSGCRQLLNASVGGEEYAEDEQDYYMDNGQYEITDLDRNTDMEEAIYVDLSRLEESTLENSIVYELGCFTICQSGNYLISGKVDDCRLVIHVYDDEVVHLIFDNIELHTNNGPAIYVEQASKVIITLKEESKNIISDGTDCLEEAEACIFSNSDLTINGSGNLKVYGYYRDAIRSKDRVKVLDAYLYIKSQNDGIRGNDGVLCKNSVLEVESKGIGIVSNNVGGYVMIEGGNCKIIAGEEAISADSYVSVQNCDYNLYSVHEAVRCNGIKEMGNEGGK